MLNMLLSGLGFHCAVNNPSLIQSPTYPCSCDHLCTPLNRVSHCVSVSHSGYIEAVVIPAGARRIKVIEDRPSHSFLGNDLCVIGCFYEP